MLLFEEWFGGSEKVAAEILVQKMQVSALTSASETARPLL